MTILALALAAAAPAAANARPGPRTCAQQPGQLLAQSTSVRVLSQSAKNGSHRVVACLRGSRRVTYLGYTARDDVSLAAIHNITVAGVTVAFDRVNSTQTSESHTVAVYDLRRRRQLSEDPAGSTDAPQDQGAALGPVSDILLRPNRHVAWMVTLRNPVGTQSIQVWARDERGLVLAADSPNLVPRSLAMSATTLYWLDGAAANSTDFS